MINKRQIQNQQMLLKALGFYRGKCDGIWSSQTTKAKQEFEISPSFKPAYPNRGMPFAIELNSKYPAGVYSDPVRPGMLTHEKLTDELVRDWSKDLVESYDNRKETVHVSKPDPEPVASDDGDEVKVPSSISNHHKSSKKKHK